MRPRRCHALLSAAAILLAAACSQGATNPNPPPPPPPAPFQRLKILTTPALAGASLHIVELTTGLALPLPSIGTMIQPAWKPMLP